MPLPENFFEEEKNKQLYRDNLYDPSSIFPDFSEAENIEEKHTPDDVEHTKEYYDTERNRTPINTFE